MDSTLQDTKLKLLIYGLDSIDQEHALNTIEWSEIIVQSEQTGISTKKKKKIERRYVHQKWNDTFQLHPKTSAMLAKFHLKLPIATRMPTKSTVISTVAAVMKRGLKILYNIRCLLNQPAHIVVARLITA